MILRHEQFTISDRDNSGPWMVTDSKPGSEELAAAFLELVKAHPGPGSHEPSARYWEGNIPELKAEPERSDYPGADVIF